MAKADNPAETSASVLVTHQVFLDTQVYRTQAHNPDSPMLLALRDHIAADRLVLHITDITLAEIERQLGEFAGEAAAAWACLALFMPQRAHHGIFRVADLGIMTP